jgi:hypothetical protein
MTSFAERQTCAGAKGQYPIEVSVGPGGNGKAVIGHTTLMNQLVGVQEGATCNTEGGGSLRDVPVKYKSRRAESIKGTSFFARADIKIDNDLRGAKEVIFVPPPRRPLDLCFQKCGCGFRHTRSCGDLPSCPPPPTCIGRIIEGYEVITKNSFPLYNWSEEWIYRLLTATDSELRVTKKRTLPDTKCEIALEMKGVNNTSFKGTVEVTLKEPPKEH